MLGEGEAYITAADTDIGDADLYVVGIEVPWDRFIF
jgi:hypothetical protein